MELVTLGAAAAGLGAIGASLRWNWWRLPKKGIPVLMYHRMGEPPPESRQKALWISARRFEEQLDILLKNGYRAINFADMEAGRIPEKPVVITFDDGYLSQYEIAFPILKKKGMTAVFYIVSEAVGKENMWHNAAEEPRQPMMDLGQIKAMIAGGMEMGSHAMTHTRFQDLSLDQARRELVESKKKLESALGVPMLSFAFPYGNGEDVPELVEAAFESYKWVVGIHSGIWTNPNKRAAIPRLYIKRGENNFDLYLQLTRGRSRL
ncbi:MAG: polysaccharide deacetylase family protein [Elusimicrobia bacterium]|nr:polysaccharide deacetylase family protein [Elusimicrobiota bacterium]